MNLAAAWALAILILVSLLFVIGGGSDGFRGGGGGEAIGGRTGGSAYSGAAADLEPQPF